MLRERHGKFGFDGNIYSDVAAYDLLGRAGYLSAVLDTVEAKVYAKNYILGAQDTDPGSKSHGSFGSVWEGTFYPDFMTTAQAVRALHYLDPQGEDEQVQEAIQAGLNWMRVQQQEDGSFAASDWDDPLIDTVEAIATLDVLEIEPTTWVHGSTGKTPVDYMEEGALNEDGSFGSSSNVMDAVWALYGYHLLGLKVEKQLTISPSIMSLEVGSKGEYTLKFHDAEGESDVTSEASWSAGNPSIAGIDGGQVTALSVGETTVTAVYGGLTVTATLKVKAAEGPGGGATPPSTCTVGVAVVGKNGELLFGPGYVLLSKEGRWGLTALGALDATGLPYRLSDKWEGFVEEIAGQSGSGMEGWCYTVNNNMPSVSAAQYTVKDGDRIIWYYSKDINESPPKWDDLVKQAASGTITAATAAQQVADLISGLQSGKITPAKALADISGLLDQVKTAEVTDELKGKLADAVKAISPLLANLPEKALSVQAAGEMRTIKIDAEAVKDHVSIIKSAAALAKKMDQLGVPGAGDLATDRLAVQLPAELSGEKGFTAEFPAAALREVADAGLGLVFSGPEASISLPQEVLQGAFSTAPGLSGLEVSVSRGDTAKLNPFKGAGVVGNRAFDLEVKALTSEGKKEVLKGGFAKKATVTFSLEGVDLGGIDKDRLAVYRQNDDGSWEFVGGSLSEDGKAFSFETDRLSLYALMGFQNPFKDTANHWAREAVEELAMRLIVRGVSDDTFAPDQPLTRAQLAALLARALKLEQQAAAQPTFRDVAPGFWGYGVIESAARAGLVKGTGDGNFEPNRPVKREEMAAVLANILKQNGLDPGLKAAQTEALLHGYKDSGEVSAWARDALAICINKGIIGGRPNATLAPGDQSNRAEAAVVLLKLLKLLGRL